MYLLLGVPYGVDDVDPLLGARPASPRDRWLPGVLRGLERGHLGVLLGGVLLRGGHGDPVA